MKNVCFALAVGLMAAGLTSCSNPPQPPPDPLANIIPNETIRAQSELDQLPRVLEWNGSLYAPTLAGDGVPAAVTVEFVVASTGMVHSVHVLRSTHLDASNQVLEVLPRWKFTPGTIAGQPVASRIVKSLSFSPGAPAEPSMF